MIPDLGKYAVTVLSSYGVTLVLLAGLVALSWARHQRVRRALQQAEARTGREG